MVLDSWAESKVLYRNKNMITIVIFKNCDKIKAELYIGKAVATR